MSNCRKLIIQDLGSKTEETEAKSKSDISHKNAITFFTSRTPENLSNSTKRVTQKITSDKSETIYVSLKGKKLNEQTISKQILFLDVDGTILDYTNSRFKNQTTIIEFNLLQETLQNAQLNNIMVILITSRPLHTYDTDQQFNSSSTSILSTINAVGADFFDIVLFTDTKKKALSINLLSQYCKSALNRTPEVMLFDNDKFEIDECRKSGFACVLANGTADCYEEVNAFLYQYNTKQIKAAERWNLLAQQGNSQAQMCLGYYYQTGMGVTRDVIKAYNLFQLAANQGESGAQFCLGNLYAEGRAGISVDRKKSIEYFTKSLEGYEHDQALENLTFLLAHSKEYFDSLIAYVKEKSLTEWPKGMLVHDESHPVKDAKAKEMLKAALVENSKSLKSTIAYGK